MIPKDSQQ